MDPNHTHEINFALNGQLPVHRSLRDGGRVTKGGVEELAHHLP